MTQKDFALLKSILSDRELLQSLAPSVAFMQPTEDDSEPDSSGSPATLTISVNSELVAAPPPPTPIVAPTLSENLSLLHSTLSKLVDDSIQSMREATSQLANQTFTVSSVMGVSVDLPFVRYAQSGGTVLSYTPSSFDYSLANYATGTPSLISTGIRGVGAFVGFTAGVGGMSGYMGKSKEFTSAFGLLSGSAVWNDSYRGVTVTLGTPSAGVAGFSGKAETTPVGEIKNGNLLDDMRSITNALWDMSQDPMNPRFSPL
jgi:hypothetical protein